MDGQTGRQADRKIDNGQDLQSGLVVPSPYQGSTCKLEIPIQSQCKLLKIRGRGLR